MQPAPCCGATGTRGLWLPLPAVTLLNLVEENASSKDDDGRRIAVVFLAAAMEMMLEHVISQMLKAHTSSIALTDAVFDAYQGLEKLQRLYNALAPKPFGTVLAEKGMGSFPADWKELAQLRNKVGHGQAYSVSRDHDELLTRIEQNAGLALMHLHNSTLNRP